MKFARVVVALALASVPLAACGGDDEDKTLSKAEYVKRGNAICAESTAEFNKLFETDFPAIPAAIPGFFDKVTPIFERQTADLRGLDGPDADQAKVDRMLAAADKAVADFKRGSKDEKLGAELFQEEGGKNQAAFEKQAKAVGLKCDEDEPSEKKLDAATFSAEKQAYIKKADAICRETVKKSSALEERYFRSFPPELEAWAKFLPPVVKLVRSDLAKTERLTPPAEDKAKIDELIARQEQIVDQFEEMAKVAATGDEAEFQAVSKDIFAETDNTDDDLVAYGFQVCGSQED